MTAVIERMNRNGVEAAGSERAESGTTALSDERWQAIVRGDPAYEHAFVFGVRTTGVYCLTTCRGTPVLRKNVEFYDTVAEARAAGYRPCKRCRPDEGGPYSRAVDVVSRATVFIDEHHDEHLPLSVIARAIGATDHVLRRSFAVALGITPRQFADQRRLERFKTDVRNGHDVTTALYDNGFGSPSRLYESADARLGMTPGQYRNGGDGIAIAYAIADSPLGKLLVARTERGICRIAIADDHATLEKMLAHEFPHASIAHDDDGLSTLVEAVAGLLSGQGVNGAAELPLDVRGTAFQRRVWEALRRIPRGETRTYSQVSEDIGQPSAARAVANACAKNPTPVVVPCHRVVRTDGTLGGYALGVERKRRLLKSEGVR